MRRSTMTPCPVIPLLYKSIEDTYDEETTTNLDYTTAFKASFRQVKPKRGPVARRGTTSFMIHEDEEPKVQLVTGTTEAAASRLTRPARRIVPPTKAQRVDEIAQTTKESQDGGMVQKTRPQGRVLAQPPTRISIISDIQSEEPPQQRIPSHSVIERSVRRKTLYMPSEDTTQPTMWMGIFSPIKNEVTTDRHVNEMAPVELTGIAAQMAEKKKKKASVARSRPRRMPLQQNDVVQGKASPSSDRRGASTGKENVPPGFEIVSDEASTPEDSKEAERVTVKVDRDAQRKLFLSQARLEHLSKPKQASSQSGPDMVTMYEIGARVDPCDTRTTRRTDAWNAGPRVSTPEVPRSRSSTMREISPKQDKHERPPPVKVPSRFVRPFLPCQPQLPPHLPIIEHIQCPELYEEDWLSQQETVVTQLLNSLFQQSQVSKQRQSRKEVREKLVAIYNTPEISQTYSRVQAALLYGSLSLTHEAMFDLQNIANDVGRRKDFLKFWLDNYEPVLLGAALEVVTGKQIAMQESRTSVQANPKGSSVRQTLAHFIEKFLLRNEDIGFKPAGTGSVNDLGGRTILRCLMLVKALDLLREIGVAGDRFLFRRNATFESSNMAVQTLMRMLNPTVGDSTRALRQLGFVVVHEQEPMQEITHHIHNIAVDLRDGVVLTRLAELLLYKSASKPLQRANDNEAHTICMPDGDTLVVDSAEPWPLTQHLKLPCISRATKIWNVQIALTAVARVKSICTLIENVTADDIVDGFREKSLKLLWALVGQYGLFGLVDCDDLKQEIRRLSSYSTVDSDLHEMQDNDDRQAQSEYLLRRWTMAVAASKGQVVKNFTTSFSDGRVFEAILDEYDPYLIEDYTGKRHTLQDRLLRLGCSRQFSDLFSRRDVEIHIFGKDFIYAALAFLCSRVVGPSRMCRNAVVIQRAWRKHWQTVMEKRRNISRDLAASCVRSVKLALDPFENMDSGSSDLSLESHAKSDGDGDIWLSL